MSRARSMEQEQQQYDESAQEYLRYLRTRRPEHFMEAPPQGKQREITIESLALVHQRRPEVQYFNELLVQYRRPGEEKIRKVVPDNMVIVHPEPIEVGLHFSIELQPVRPFWTLEYVSKGNKRKDYVRSFGIYEELRIPYYLAFYPDNEELNLWRLNTRKRYSSVKANGGDRFAIKELELEVGLLDGWVRFWFRGELLPLPGDMQRELDALRQDNKELQQRLADLQAEVERLRAGRKSG